MNDADLVDVEEGAVPIAAIGPGAEEVKSDISYFWESHQDLARSLDHAGADGPSLELRRDVTHAAAMTAEVAQHLRDAVSARMLRTQVDQRPNRGAQSVPRLPSGDGGGVLERYVGFDCGAVFAQAAFGVEGDTLCGATLGLRNRGGWFDFDVQYAETIATSHPGVLHVQLSVSL